MTNSQAVSQGRAPLLSLSILYTLGVTGVLFALISGCASMGMMEDEAGYPSRDSDYNGDGNGSEAPDRDYGNGDMDDGSPETIRRDVFMEPAASERYVFALSETTDLMAIIDAATLSIETVPLPAQPVDLSVLPGRNAVVVVSKEGRRLTLLDEEDGDWRVISIPVQRRFQAVSVCPDGRWAVLWTPEGHMPDAGAEGIIAVVDLALMETQADSIALELAAGRRHTDVFFRQIAGETVDILVVGSEELAVVETDSLENPTPQRIRIPVEYSDVNTRQVVVSRDGSIAILRSFVEPLLMIFDSESREYSSIALPAIATDIAMLPHPSLQGNDAAILVAAIRSQGMIVWFEIDRALDDPEGEILETVEIEGVVPGQLVASQDGRYVAVFTNSEPSTSVAWLDFVEDRIVVFDRLQKWIDTVGISNDGKTAIVLHRSNPNSTNPDPYERFVEKEEGYSIVDLEQGFSQLKTTQGIPPKEVVFSEDGYAGVVLTDKKNTHRVDVVDLNRLTSSSLPLASQPSFSGAIPISSSVGGKRMWVTQEHPTGRVSFINPIGGTMRTVTGYGLNAEIE